MQAPVLLIFCATANWKNGWSFLPMPHTRTRKSNAARGAAPWADIDYNLLAKPSLICLKDMIRLDRFRRDYDSHPGRTEQLHPMAAYDCGKARKSRYEITAMPSS